MKSVSSHSIAQDLIDRTVFMTPYVEHTALGPKE